MLNQPTSSPMMTTMLGFLSSARAGSAKLAKDDRNAATHTTTAPLVSYCSFFEFARPRHFLLKPPLIPVPPVVSNVGRDHTRVGKLTRRFGQRNQICSGSEAQQRAL